MKTRLVALLAFVLFVPRPARADGSDADRARESESEERDWQNLKEKKSEAKTVDLPPKNDTSYGRIDGDLSASLGLGMTIAPRAPRLQADVRFRYIDTIGVYGTYEEGNVLGLHSEPRRVLATGLELRPLFVARWLQGKEWGVPRLDLAVDSFGLELGAFFAQPVGSSFGTRPGLQAGLGFEVPIFARASGPWIGFHGGARWSDAALGGQPLDGPSDRSLFLSISVAYHVFFGGHVVDVGDVAAQ